MRYNKRHYDHRLTLPHSGCKSNSDRNEQEFRLDTTNYQYFVMTL